MPYPSFATGTAFLVNIYIAGNFGELAETGKCMLPAGRILLCIAHFYPEFTRAMR